MPPQFIVRSQGLERDLKLRTVVYGGVEIKRLTEHGLAVFEISDPDVVLELVIKRKSPPASSDLKASADVSKPSPCDKEHSKETNVSQSAPALTHRSSTVLKQQSCEYSAEDIEATYKYAFPVKNPVFAESKKMNSWNERFNEFLHYKRTFGHCDVPQKWKPNPKLSAWVDHNRHEYKKGRAPAARVAKLNAVGFIWDAIEARWNMRYSQLMLYKQEHGDCIVPQKYHLNPQLGEWVITQRKHFRKGWLSLERIGKLNQINFVWDARGISVKKNTSITLEHDDEPITHGHDDEDGLL